MDNVNFNLYIIATGLYFIRIIIFLTYYFFLRNRVSSSLYVNIFLFVVFMIFPYFIIGCITKDDGNQYRELYYSFYMYAADFWFLISLITFFLYKKLIKKIFS